MKLKQTIWIFLCIAMFLFVVWAWFCRVVVKEGTSNIVNQPNAKATKDHSKNVSEVENMLNDLDDILTPIYNQVSQQNQIIRVVVDKEPKESYTSPDITLSMENPDDIMPTMHIVLPQGIEGDSGDPGRRGTKGPDGPMGPRGPQG